MPNQTNDSSLTPKRHDKLKAFLSTSPTESARKIFRTLYAALRVAGREAEARIQAEALALELAEAVAQRDRLIDLAAHELKTPLTALKLQLQLNERLHRKIGTAAFNEERAKSLFSQSLLQCDRLVKLIDDMLDVSRIRAGRLVLNTRHQNISEILLKVVENYRSELDFVGCQVEVKVHEDVYAAIDSDRVARVFSCLCSNLVQHAPKSSVEISLTQEGNRVIARFRDSGPGISGSMAPHLFESGPSPRDLSGLGMSLHISRAIARAHGGDVHLNRQWKKGAEFIVEFPAG